MQRSHEVIVAPGSDAGFLVRRDIARVNRPKWRLEGDAARERLPARKGMAGDAVSGPRQIFAARQWLLDARRRPGHGGLRCVSFPTIADGKQRKSGEPCSEYDKRTQRCECNTPYFHVASSASAARFRPDAPAAMVSKAKGPANPLSSGPNLLFATAPTAWQT